MSVKNEKEFYKAVNQYKILHASKKQELYDNIFKENPSDNFLAYKTLIKNYLNIRKNFNSLCMEFWLDRGFSEEESYKLSLERKRDVNKTTISPFSRQFWLNKGFSEEEADFRRNSIRPIKKEYWIAKGFSEEEAVILAKNTKKSNNVKGANVNKLQENSFKHKYKSPRNKEYWILQGYSEEEATEKVSEAQATFSLEKCIEKYGEEEGYRVWKERQDKWQNALKSKPQEELDRINSLKDAFNLQNYIEKYGQELGKLKFKNNLLSKGVFLFDSLEDIKEYLIFETTENPYLLYKGQQFLSDFISDYNWYFINKPDDLFRWASEFLNFKTDGEIFRNNYNMYNKFVDGKLLRSSNEIVFFDVLISLGLKHNVDFFIDKPYPFSKMRYDFYLVKPSIYIELGGFPDDEQYVQKMKYKENTFKSVVLWNKNEYYNFLSEIYENDNRNIMQFL